MTMESALAAQGKTHARVPTGLRRLTPSLLQVNNIAGTFSGLPEGVSVPGQLLAALKAAAPRLGLAPRLVHAVDWLFRFTQAQDWGRGGRPIVWPSASLQQEALGLSPTQVKAMNRQLIEAGLLTMKDSPNGKRYGKRDPKGRIVEAYGFDLSPIAARHAEFVRLAGEARAERIEFGRLRRRATIARNGIAQILETAAEYAFEGEEWVQLRQDSYELVRALRKVERPEEMALGVENLERRQRTARERLESLLSAMAPAASEAVNSDPMGPENRPHIYNYKPNLNPQEDTVIASEVCKSRAEGPVSNSDTVVGAREGQEGRAAPPGRDDRGTVMRLATDELVRMAPRLKPYLASASPTWRDIVDAADWLRHDLGVSKALWGEACLAMGREHAAIALAIVSAKPAEHFRTGPGAYFHGMVVKAKAGDLHLNRTVWGLRSGGEKGRPTARRSTREGRGRGGLRTGSEAG